MFQICAFGIVVVKGIITISAGCAPVGPLRLTAGGFWIRGLRLSCGAARAVYGWGQCTTNFFFLFLLERGGQKFSLFRLASPEYPTRVRGIAYFEVYPQNSLGLEIFRLARRREEAPITIAVCELPP